VTGARHSSFRRDAVVTLWESGSGLHLTYLRYWGSDDTDARPAAIAAVADRVPADHWLTAALDEQRPARGPTSCSPTGHSPVSAQRGTCWWSRGK
jgi:hypothetical protein